ncbi:hypothetical protein BC829DRAFT_405388 [Chytridium lagenaria]|nr:hypothetical protein BC829DRAFT_405388 [Chytridium lagenaria]
METWRTWRLRSNHLDLLKHIRAAEGMRDQYRRRQKQKALMRRFTGRLEENKVVCDALSKKLKASWRQVYKGKKGKLRKEKVFSYIIHRVVIHIPSISCSLNLRRGMRNIRMQQLQQLGRLTDIQDPNVIVILVYLPIEGDEFLEEQFQMFISGAYDAYKLMNEGRFWIVIPEAYSAFPETAPLSAMLYSSARAMKQIKDLVGDLPAYIQTGIPGDLTLKSALNIPLMQPYSTVEPMLFSKSLQRELLSESMVQMAPGCSFIKTEEDFLCAARQLILNNSNFYRFINKNGREVDSRGIAYFDTKRFTKNWSQKAYWRPLLLMNLCRPLPSSSPRCSCNFQRYLSRFLEQGGIIEGAPPVATYELKETGDAILDADLLSGPPSRSPSVFFMIEPDGTLVLKGSVDKPYNFWGCLAPHQSCEAEELYEAAENVARLCAVRGIFGLISIDFAVWDDLAQEERHIWAVGFKTILYGTLLIIPAFLPSYEWTCHPTSRAARTSGFDKPFRVMFDANIARRLNLRYLSRIPIGPEERFGIISTRFCHPGFKYISPHAAVFDPRWKLGALYMPAFQSNRTQLAFMFTSKSAIDAIETVLTTLIVLYRRLLTTYIDQGNNFMEITKALLLKPPPGEPELFDVTWQRRRSGPQISPVAIEISHAEILEARRRVSLPTKRFSPKMEVHRTSLRPVTAKDLLAAPSMGGSFASISFTSLPDILVSGAVDAIEEDPAEIIYRDREDQDSNKGSEDSDEDNPARFSPMELLLRRVIKLPDFGSLGLSNFNPNQFQHEVRRLQTRRRQPHEGEVPTRPVLSLESSMETMRILNTPIPSLVLRRMDPSFCNIKPLNGPILPEHFNDPARVPTGLPLETYMAIMERRATEKEEEEKLAAKQREMQERKKEGGGRNAQGRGLRRGRKMLEEEEERLKWEDQMRKATEGKSLIEKVAIESELLKKRDEEHRKKVQQEVSEEEAKIKEGRTRDELLAERVENKRNIVSLKDFMDRGQKLSLRVGIRDSRLSVFGYCLGCVGDDLDLDRQRRAKPVLSVFRYLRDEFLGLEHEDT